MDFIEPWLGISPDGGDGTFEVLVLTALLIGLALVLIRKRLNAR